MNEDCMIICPSHYTHFEQTDSVLCDQQRVKLDEAIMSVCDLLSSIPLIVMLVGNADLTDAKDLTDVGISERFLQDLSFNSSQTTGLVSIGALSLLLVATGLYLFNYYSSAARSDDVPLYDPYGAYNPGYHTSHAR